MVKTGYNCGIGFTTQKKKASWISGSWWKHRSRRMRETKAANITGVPTLLQGYTNWGYIPKQSTRSPFTTARSPFFNRTESVGPSILMDCRGGAGADLTWTWQGIVFYFNLLAIHQRFPSKQVNDTHKVW